MQMKLIGQVMLATMAVAALSAFAEGAVSLGGNSATHGEFELKFDANAMELKNENEGRSTKLVFESCGGANDDLLTISSSVSVDANFNELSFAAEGKVDLGAGINGGGDLEVEAFLTTSVRSFRRRAVQYV